jgi:hypothetical protein
LNHCALRAFTAPIGPKYKNIHKNTSPDIFFTG